MAIMSLIVIGSPAASQTQAENPTPTAKQPSPNPAYILQRGDDIDLRVVDLPDLSQSAKIRPDGRISVVLLNDVDAAGLTPTQLGDQLSEGYAKHYRNPKVTVIVRSFSNQAVFVGGEVTTPRLVTFTGRMTLAGAIISVGGVTPYGRLKDVVLLRDSGAGRPVVSKINVKNILKKGEPDPELKPFDVVFVSRTRIGSISRFVEQYIKQVLPFSPSLGFNYILNQQPLIQ